MWSRPAKLKVWLPEMLKDVHDGQTRFGELEMGAEAKVDEVE